MSDKKITNIYDDDNIPEVDLPKRTSSKSERSEIVDVEPLPESTRPRKNGPGGE